MPVAPPPFSTRLGNTLYGVAGQRARFERQHPEEPVLVAGATKAVRRGAALTAQRGAHWVFSRRSVLLATPQRLVCGDWEIPTAQVAEARLLAFRTLNGRGMLLQITSQEGVFYQFGLGADPAWEALLPFPLLREQGALGWSRFSVFMRLVLLAFLVYWVWHRLGGG